ncbi:LPS-assembly protein LptD [Saccharophagus degradans]|uniref:LPS-assembly protein LptD n=1 Tax=Saccharophagus degradans TaxID=86304 RepID=A0AAW7X691_9GAMM|nr:LPS-assembly protein LptD [Saccharophagus degradans]MDO6423092.1 LPS-assembly protein LptD [Saccharophagus degradans]MDO6607384.1 LPS-assembly protein LptD [Saccharophagus degradans]
MTKRYFSLLAVCSAIATSTFADDTPTNSLSLGKTYLRCYPQADSNQWDCAEYSSETNLPIGRSQIQQAPNAYDFVLAENLTPAAQSALLPGCTGMYIDPLGDQTNAPSPENTPLIVEADDSVLTGAQKAQLDGNVQISQGARSIRADSMTYSRETEEASLAGGVTIRNPGLLIRGDKASMSTTRNQASFENAIFVLHGQHIRGQADAIRQTSDSSIVLEGGSITSCEPGSNAWSLGGAEIKIDNEKGQGTGKHITLKVGKVPVMYVPYIAFPLGDQRQSGLLFPSISSSDNGGLDAAVPFYWNMAPNYDATITPRIISGRGAMLEVEGRHLNKRFYTESNIAYLPNDDGGQDKDLDTLVSNGDITESQAHPYTGQNRWLGHLSQQGGSASNGGWYSTIDFTKVSDQDYFRDLGASSFSEQNQSYLDQRAELGYLFEHWTVSAMAQNRQVLLYDLDTPYRRAPQLNAIGHYSVNGFEFKLDNELVRFDHPSNEWRNGDTLITGSRLSTDYRAAWPIRGRWGFIKPEVGYKALGYQLESDGLASSAESSPTLGAAQASIDMSVIFEHRGGSIMQTIEPRVYYLHRAYTDHSDLYAVTTDGQNVNFDTSIRTFSYSQLFRDSRFGGRDRLDDANQTTVGLTSRWYSNESGRELFSASIGQVFHNADRRVGLNGEELNTGQTSELAADVSVMLGPLSRFYVNSIYDTEAAEITRASSGVYYHSQDLSTLANLSYSYVRDYRQSSIAAGTTEATDIDQVDLSFVTPINKQWSLMGRYNYDFTQAQELETFLGFEYNDCCYRVRLLARKWLDSNIASLTDNHDLEHDQGVFFEVHFKGLGGSGAKVNSILEDSIRGYQERERRNKQ